MPVSLNRIGQIAMGVRDVDRAEAFYQAALGLRKLYRFGDLVFFDCAGIRLLLEKAHDPEGVNAGSPIYFSCADIALTVRELQQRGVVFSSLPHLTAKMDDHDLWMAFF
jgi:methylmalonyl-CoA/ethylmalonyl-CoA epimerase